MNDTPSADQIATPSEYVVSDTGAFAIVPEWVLDAEVSDRAVRLYGLLARYADQRGLAWPRRAVLAERLRTSVKSVDRAMAELETLRAVEVEARFDDGGQRSNYYRVRRVCPYPSSVVTPPPGQDGRPPLVTGVAQKESHGNENQGTRTDTPAVSDDVLRLCGVLAEKLVENGCKPPSMTKSGWLDPMRLLLEKDYRRPEQVERAILWATSDEFWRANIMSPGALRRNYDRLRLAAQRDRARAGTTAQVADAAAEYLARHQ